MEESILMWNRLEGSLRNENQLDNALRFEIRDALWMLTRQWQFGELDGEDAGSAAFAHIQAEECRVNGIGRSGSLTPFDIQNGPFEQAIESEQFEPDMATRIGMGRHWERIIRRRLAASEANKVIQMFRGNTRFHFQAGLPPESDRAAQFQHAQSFSDADHIALVNAVSNDQSSIV